jgi:hypothetical protein
MNYSRRSQRHVWRHTSPGNLSGICRLQRLRPINLKQQKDFHKTWHKHYTTSLCHNFLSLIIAKWDCHSRKLDARTILVSFNAGHIISYVTDLPGMCGFSKVTFFRIWNNIMVAVWKLYRVARRVDGHISELYRVAQSRKTHFRVPSTPSGGG